MNKLSAKERRSLIVDVLTAVRCSSFPPMRVSKHCLGNKDKCPDEVISLDSNAVASVFETCCDHIMRQIAEGEKKH